MNRDHSEAMKKIAADAYNELHKLSGGSEGSAMQFIDLLAAFAIQQAVCLVLLFPGHEEEALEELMKDMRTAIDQNV